MNFIKKFFIKKKQYKCEMCRDIGVIKTAEIFGRVIEYWDGTKVINFSDSSILKFEYLKCIAYCETAKENEIKNQFSSSRNGSSS